MISIGQAIIMGLFQGVSELFPISSLGHSVVLPKLLHWNINQNDPFFLVFLVATHIATAMVLFCFFWRDWFAIIRGIFRSLKNRGINPANNYDKLGWLLVVGTIPAGLVGLLLEEPLRAIFASPRSAAFFLILNGGLLYAAELLRRRAPYPENPRDPDENLGKLSFKQAFGVGLVQILALIPGFSRSGATMGGGLLVGLSNEDSARYSFLLATPIIAAAGVLKLPELLAPQNHSLLLPALLGGLAAAVAAYFAVKFLLRFFQTNKLTPFAVYCAALGLVLSVYFTLLR